jgi:hypothetical protein
MAVAIGLLLLGDSNGLPATLWVEARSVVLTLVK